MNENSTDELLLTAAKAGDQKAFLLLFKRHHTTIFRFLYRFLGSAKAAEDITHDCFLELVRNPEDSRFSEGSLLTHLYASARNLAMQHSHHLEEKTHANAPAANQQGHRAEQPIAEAHGELVEAVKQAIKSLPPLEREALILFEYDGLPVNEIGSIVGADDEAVRARLNEARQRLRTELSRYFA